MECPENCPPNVYELMRRCWQWEPAHRPTFEQIYKDLENMFHDASTSASPLTINQSVVNNSSSSSNSEVKPVHKDYISSTLPSSNNSNSNNGISMIASLNQSNAAVVAAAPRPSNHSISSSSLNHQLQQIQQQAGSNQPVVHLSSFQAPVLPVQQAWVILNYFFLYWIWYYLAVSEIN